MYYFFEADRYYGFHCDTKMFNRFHLYDFFLSQIFAQLVLNYSGIESDIKQYER